MNDQPNDYLDNAAEVESNEFDLREESKRVRLEEDQLILLREEMDIEALRMEQYAEESIEASYHDDQPD